MWNAIVSVINDPTIMRPEIVFELIRGLLYSIASGLLSAYVAKKKGYSMLIWFLIGFFTRIFGLIAIAGIPEKKEDYPHAGTDLN